jgi:hypothetical protein
MSWFENGSEEWFEYFKGLDYKPCFFLAWDEVFIGAGNGKFFYEYGEDSVESIPERRVSHASILILPEKPNG